ncbi:circadian locomoter output cycles protein kaput-like [Branchiostoma floridae]|uniref:Circadian locomoter output cycles protein kaput-like n=1 Tax=Branchiostoma floridae TaxID=7739 RepID=A0A9J7LFH1_BRAFL|nr:circadian locomoter output cycles protein kaput-like [Branchiostoma floridae]
MKRRADTAVGRHARDSEEDANHRDGPVSKSRKGAVRRAASAVSSPADSPAVNGQPSPDSNSTSSKRKIRSLAEKNRRDKLTSFISQLSTLLPLANTPDKKLDKCDVLRLAVNYLKVQKYLINSDDESSKAHWPSWMTEEQLQKLLLESNNGFLLVVDKRGTILHLHESVNYYLGIPQNQITGRTVQALVHPEDLHILYEHVPLLQPFHQGQEGEPVSLSSSDGNLSFCVRVVCRNTTNKAGFFSYKFAHFKGHTQPLVDDSDGEGKLLPPLVLVAVVRPYMESVFKEMSSFFSRENEVIILHNLQGVCEFADQRMFKFGALATEIQKGSVYEQVDKEDLKYVSHAHSVIYDTCQTSTVFRIKRRMHLGYCHSITYVIKDRWTSRPKGFLSFFSVLSEKEGRLRWKKQDKDYRSMMAAKQTLSLPGEINTNTKEESLSPVSSNCPVISHMAVSSAKLELPDDKFGLCPLKIMNLSSEVPVGEKSHFQNNTGCLETVVWPSPETSPAQQAPFDTSSSNSPLSFSKSDSSGGSSPQTPSGTMSDCLTPSHFPSHSSTYTSPGGQNATLQTTVADSLLRQLIESQTSPVSSMTANSDSMHHNGHMDGGFINGTQEEVACTSSEQEMLGSLSAGEHEGQLTSRHPSVAVVHPTQARAMVSSNGPVDLQPLADPLGVFTSPSEDAQPVLQASLTPSSQCPMTEEYRINQQLAKQQRQLSQQVQQYKREMQLVQNQLDLNKCIMKLQKLKGKDQDLTLLTELDQSVKTDIMCCPRGVGDQLDKTDAFPFTAPLDIPLASTTATTTTKLP